MIHADATANCLSRLKQSRGFPFSKDLRVGASAPNATSMAVETTLILFKPDAISKNLTGKVLARFEEAGFVIRGIKMMKLDDAVLREHYSHIADKPFFPDIVTFMSQTPVIALALEGEDIIGKVRDLLGPTNSKTAAPGTIRGDFGEDMMVNVCHASDSPEAAAAEIKRFFKDGEVFSY
jgi:nucleoside-diphosphate kinase